MARIKAMPRRIIPRRHNRKYIIKAKLDTPKVVRFGNKQFTVRYKRISKKGL